jgi:predicted membrane chloride channel (bestrophin family)
MRVRLLASVLDDGPCLRPSLALTRAHAISVADLKFMEDAIGGCERLFRTPIPLSYTRHTSRLLLFWLAYLPLALFAELRWHALFVAPLLVLILFGIDEIGVELEEPFTLLPLETLCDAIKAQSTELLAADVAMRGMVSGYEPEAKA